MSRPPSPGPGSTSKSIAQTFLDDLSQGLEQISADSDSESSLTGTFRAQPGVPTSTSTTGTNPPSVKNPHANSAGFSRIDVSHIGGSATTRTKRIAVAMFNAFVTGKAQPTLELPAPQPTTESYGEAVGRRVGFSEINIRDNGGFWMGETVMHVRVFRDMCNVYGTLHGACASYLIDHCSTSALIALATELGFDGTGVSHSMHIIWHQPIPLDTHLKIVSTTMSTRGRMRSMRTEIWDQDNNVLCISAIHSTSANNAIGDSRARERAKL